MELFSSYTGPDFLAFYALLMATTVAAGFWVPAKLRPPGKLDSVDHAEEMAILAAGPKRHAHALATDLMAHGALANASSKKLRVVSNNGVETTSAGRSVLRKIGDFDIRELCVTTAADAHAITNNLTDRGLIMTAQQRERLRWLSVSPYAALLVVGLYRAIAGFGEGEAIGFLVVMMLIAATLAAWRWMVLNPRTEAGNETVAKAQAEASRLRQAPEAKEAAYAVALFGTGVLVGTPWQAVHGMQNSAVASSSSGAAAGCGGKGSSDGGGGCGGCGG